ncbi:Rieske (2Fe-2S) protein [Streptomyces sp. NPDC050504]|uniref:Rieske (2Fe-2S) protein n=1 Tax=Streptomyces sp. NPDC050504 TaxID=3365618 RepID=UPI0037B15441
MTASQEQAPEQHPARPPGRRTVMAAVGAAGLAAALSACGDSDGGDGGSGDVQDGTNGGQASSPGGPTPGSGDTGGTPPAEKPEGDGKVLAKTSDIPEGGGKVFASERVVVTQPKAGEFKAFSATCTHQGCVVKEIAEGTINCPCHGSRFDVSDGSVKGGPAPRPLPSAAIEVSEGSIRLK